MRHPLLYIILLFIGIFNASAQDSTAVNSPQTASVAPASPVKLNRSAEALGISPQVEARLKKLSNRPVNIALFAVDRRDKEELGNSDVIMVISIDQQSGKVKMASIMRDTYVKIDGHGMDKLNAAFALGGPQLAIKTLNQNFDLDIKDYLNVDFFGAAKIVDALNGIEVNVKAAELPHLKNYLDELAVIEKIPAVHVLQPGLQKLNGKQAVAYTRIRAVGNGDYERTERQRNVLISLFNKIKGSGQELFPVFATQILPNMETSMANFTLLNFAGNILNSKTKTIDQARFPLDKESTGKRINNIWYLTTDLKTTANSLHNFIYNSPPAVKK